MALVLLSGVLVQSFLIFGGAMDSLTGVHYCTGHFFDIMSITEAGHRKASQQFGLAATDCKL